MEEPKPTPRIPYSRHEIYGDISERVEGMDTSSLLNSHDDGILKIETVNVKPKIPLEISQEFSPEMQKVLSAIHRKVILQVIRILNRYEEHQVTSLTTNRHGGFQIECTTQVFNRKENSLQTIIYTLQSTYELDALQKLSNNCYQAVELEGIEAFKGGVLDHYMPYRKVAAPDNIDVFDVVNIMLPNRKEVLVYASFDEQLSGEEFRERLIRIMNPPDTKIVPAVKIINGSKNKVSGYCTINSKDWPIFKYIWDRMDEEKQIADKDRKKRSQKVTSRRRRSKKKSLDSSDSGRHLPVSV